MRARKVLAFLLVFAGAVALASSAYSSVFRICDLHAFVVADRLATIELCSPARFADLAPVWIVASALMWPDIKSLNLLGVGFERRLEQTERRILAVGSRLPPERLSRSVEEKSKTWRLPDGTTSEEGSTFEDDDG